MSKSSQFVAGKDKTISSLLSPLAYMLEVMTDPLCSRERRDAMAKAVFARTWQKENEAQTETVAVLRYGMIEAGTAAAEKLERLLSGPT